MANKYDDPLEALAETMAHSMILAVINSANSREEIKRYAESLRQWALIQHPNVQRGMFMIAGIVDEWLRANPDPR